MKTYRQFNLAFIGLTLPWLLTVGGINFAIDPYGIMNREELLGLKLLKTEKFLNSKLFKSADVIRVKPKTILLGSSRTDLGLDPQHPVLDGVQPAYNLGLVGPNMYEVKSYFEHAIANNPELKTVVIGIDLFMFNTFKVNEVDFDESRLNQKRLTLKDIVNTTLSTQAIDSSFKTLKASVKFGAYYLYRSDGLRYVYGNKPNEPLLTKFQNMIAGFNKTEGYYRRYELSEKHLAALQEIIDTCQERNIEIKIFISPSHASQWEAVRAAGFWEVFEQWKRSVVQIAPVWDFSGYNSITTEAITDDMKNYWDSSHYRKEVGDLILNRLFGHGEEKVPADFGVLLTPDNIESHLEQIRVEREKWARDNADVVEWVEDLRANSE